MKPASHTDYLGYDIAISQEMGRYTPRVTRAGALIAHDGRVSEVWAGASCGSYEKALETAKTALETRRIR